MATVSLDVIEKGLQGLVDSLKAASVCCQAGADIAKIQESVQVLTNEAEKIHVTDADFLEYKKQLKDCTGILIKLEVPCQKLNVMSGELKKMLTQILCDQQWTSELISDLKNKLNQMTDMASELCKGVDEIKHKMKKVREYCTRALASTSAEAEKLKGEASSKRRSGTFWGSGMGAVGVGAVSLGILGICTGGAAFVAAGAATAAATAAAAAGVVGAAAGAGAAVAGGSLAADGVLSARDLDRKAADFRDAVRAIELAEKGVERLEEDTEKGVVKLTADMLKGLEAGLRAFSKMEQDRKRVVEAESKSEQLQGRVSTLEEENAALLRELEEVKMGLKK